jgi:hypothetical protein
MDEIPSSQSGGNTGQDVDRGIPAIMFAKVPEARRDHAPNPLLLTNLPAEGRHIGGRENLHLMVLPDQFAGQMPASEIASPADHIMVEHEDFHGNLRKVWLLGRGINRSTAPIMLVLETCRDRGTEVNAVSAFKPRYCWVGNSSLLSTLGSPPGLKNSNE